MKKNTLYLFILLLITGLNTSCNYLDIVPDETATEKDAFANPRAALRYFLLRISASVKHGSVMYGLYR
jgi:hypothetical protein